MHLVPFGEYIPARAFMPLVARIVPIEDFTAGKEFKIYSITGLRDRGPVLKFGTLICLKIFKRYGIGFCKARRGFSG